jgi:hypothetical protein
MVNPRNQPLPAIQAAFAASDHEHIIRTGFLKPEHPPQKHSFSPEVRHNLQAFKLVPVELAFLQLRQNGFRHLNTGIDKGLRLLPVGDPPEGHEKVISLGPPLNNLDGLMPS